MPRHNRIQTVKLWCKRGNHEWTTTLAVSAKPPVNCDEHKRKLSDEHKAKMHEGKATQVRAERETKISEILEMPRAEHCRCPIRLDITDAELRQIFREGTNCTRNAGYICPTLDNVMRKVYVYD